MTACSILAHGSYWAGIADASDTDVLVISDEPIGQEDAAARVVPLLPPDAARRLDLSVVTCEQVRESVLLRAVVQQGRLIAGDPVDWAAEVTPGEWGPVMREVARLSASTAGEAALTLLRAWWADEGRLVLPKSAVVAAAAGTAYEALAAAAWVARKAPDVTMQALLVAAGAHAPSPCPKNVVARF